MAFSEAQYKNFIKVISVAAVAKEFRKSRMMERIKSTIKSENLIATGELYNFGFTKAIIPTSDDRWLVDDGNIIVNTVTLGPNNTPFAVDITIRIRYGLDEFKYFNLLPESGDNRWFPNIDNVLKSIKAKKERGYPFYYIDKNGQEGPIEKDWQLKSVAFLVSRKIYEKGIDKKDFLKSFDNQSYGVEASLGRAKQRINERLIELYETSVLEIHEDIMSNIF